MNLVYTDYTIFHFKLNTILDIADIFLRMIYDKVEF